MNDTKYRSDGNGGVVPEKPPLGVKPAWIAHQQRIKDLTQAIERTVSVPVPNYGLCVKWAFEIQTLCSMLDKIYRMEGKT